jgi:hypothetical protein
LSWARIDDVSARASRIFAAAVSMDAQVNWA